MIDKHIVIDKKSLLLDWGTSPLVQSAPSKNDIKQVRFYNWITPPINQFKSGWRLPWGMVDMEDLYEMNYHITISPDPKHTADFRNNKIAFQIFRQFLDQLKKNKLYTNIISVYEYGKRGKEYGKLHWHCLFKTNKVRQLETVSNLYFGTSKKRCKNTTVVKKISTDKSLPNSASPKMKRDNYISQVDYIMKQYMQKETQNKVKCLYTNMVLSEKKK